MQLLRRLQQGLPCKGELTLQEEGLPRCGEQTEALGQIESETVCLLKGRWKPAVPFHFAFMVYKSVCSELLCFMPDTPPAVAGICIHMGTPGRKFTSGGQFKCRFSVNSDDCGLKLPTVGQRPETRSPNLKAGGQQKLRLAAQTLGTGGRVR
ncbi:hypothetical protein E5288_WYG012138 [Bos mutus]|uniref:Uncharacterized protein n=1 Tax=Bos mutus TaxID=72004 RepID=A0A6B0R5B9_9CETA|nr:hypothetical protein [Bos mutus]